jgi:hypothetical protein
MSLNASFAPGRFSPAGKVGLVTDEALCCGSFRHQFGIFLGMCLKGCRGKWANS